MNLIDSSSWAVVTLFTRVMPSSVHRISDKLVSSCQSFPIQQTLTWEFFRCISHRRKKMFERPISLYNSIMSKFIRVSWMKWNSWSWVCQILKPCKGPKQLYGSKLVCSIEETLKVLHVILFKARQKLVSKFSLPLLWSQFSGMLDFKTKAALMTKSRRTKKKSPYYMLHNLTLLPSTSTVPFSSWVSTHSWATSSTP